MELEAVKLPPDVYNLAIAPIYPFGTLAEAFTDATASAVVPVVKFRVHTSDVKVYVCPLILGVLYGEDAVLARTVEDAKNNDRIQIITVLTFFVFLLFIVYPPHNKKYLDYSFNL